LSRNFCYLQRQFDQVITLSLLFRSGHNHRAGFESPSHRLQKLAGQGHPFFNVLASLGTCLGMLNTTGCTSDDSISVGTL
jgi:hypothetical protein